jgi:hypothetical protein
VKRVEPCFDLGDRVSIPQSQGENDMQCVNRQMMKYAITTAAAMWLVLPQAAHGSPTPQPKRNPRNVVGVASVAFDPETRKVDVDIVNNTAKSVMALAITVYTTYASGEEVPEHVTEDVSWHLIHRRILATNSDRDLSSRIESLRPGEHSHYRTLAQRSNSEEPVVMVRAVLTAALFVDGTAKGDPRDIENIRSSWRQELADTRRWLPILNTLAHSSTPTKDASALLQRLEQSDFSRNGASASAPTAEVLRRYLSRMPEDGAMPSSGASILLQKFFELSQARATVLYHHLSGAAQFTKPGSGDAQTRTREIQ